MPPVSAAPFSLPSGFGFAGFGPFFGDGGLGDGLGLGCGLAGIFGASCPTGTSGSVGGGAGGSGGAVVVVG